MGKTIKKTVLFTVLCLIAVLFLTVFAIFAFAPKTAGDLCNGIGLKGSALACYEREYRNTGEFDDLTFLLDHAIFEDDYERTATYGEIAFSRTTDFDSFCAQIDAGKEENDYPSYDYYATAVANAYYSLGQKQKVAEFTLNHVPDDGYESTTALYYAVTLAKNDDELRDCLGREYESRLDWTFMGRTTFRNEIKEMGYNFN